MNADLICVGNELLTGLVENSNAGYLARRIWSLGMTVREAVVVADTGEAIGQALGRALEESEIVIITGGLGPTDDDLTREAVAAYLGLPLHLNKKWLDKMERFFESRGIKMPAGNRRQAEVIEGAVMLDNPRGTAPGALIERQGRLIVMLPGPPNELQQIYEASVHPYLAEFRRGNVSMVKTLKCVGLGESMLEEKIKAIGRWNLPPISYVARGYEVFLQIKGNGDPDSAAATIEAAENLLRETLGDHIYGSDDDTLAGVVASMLVERGLTLALAESCTGGLLSDQVTDIPGSSRFYSGGMVSYSGAAKSRVLGVETELLEKWGEVSEQTAAAMARQVRVVFNADLGVGITGLAGPNSDPSGRPLGLVYIAFASSWAVDCRQLNVIGGRRAVKERAAQAALDMLRKQLLDSRP